MQARVFGFVNYAHATTAELFEDAVVRDGVVNHEWLKKEEYPAFGLNYLTGRGIEVLRECARKHRIVYHPLSNLVDDSIMRGGLLSCTIC